MSQTGTRNRFWREPLVHFLIIGALIFGVHGWWSERQAQADRTISISTEQIQRLATIWASETGREPTRAEMKSMLAEYQAEEVLYREALRLGLQREDTIIRRRLAQKMRFLVARDELVEPLSEAELAQAYEANKDSYARAERVDFMHVPFNFDADGDDRAEEMAAALRALETGGSRADASEMGDPFLLSRTHKGMTRTELTRLFGRDFAAQVFALEGDDWAGPIRSRLANHLVRVQRRQKPEIPAFEGIREEVRAIETQKRVREANDAEMAKLLERYTFIINGDPS